MLLLRITVEVKIIIRTSERKEMEAKANKKERSKERKQTTITPY